jgi:hypothetical protein
MHAIDLITRILSTRTHVIGGEQLDVTTVSVDHMPSYEVAYVGADDTQIDLTDGGNDAYEAYPSDAELAELLAAHRCPRCGRVFAQELDGVPCDECASECDGIDQVIGVHLAPWAAW